jgi:hypothetical protein
MRLDWFERTMPSRFNATPPPLHLGHGAGFKQGLHTTWIDDTVLCIFPGAVRNGVQDHEIVSGDLFAPEEQDSGRLKQFMA